MRLFPFIVLHVCAGTVGLLSGAAAMTFRKGSARHAQAGNIFVVSMLMMSALGAGMGWIEHLRLMNTQMMNLFNGVLTFYLVATGWATAKRVSGKIRIFDGIALFVVLVDGVSMLAYANKAAHSLTGSTDGYPTGVYVFFGSIALLAAAGDVRMFIHRGVFGAPRILRHLWRMSFALLIAVVSLFLGQQKVFPAAVRGSKMLFIPPLLVLGVMIFWLIRMSFSTTVNAREHPIL